MKTPPKKPSTLSDVAKIAGVTSMTVSRVVNQGGYVSEGTRQKVLTVIRQLNYRRNGWWLYIAWLPLFLNQVYGSDLKQIGPFAWMPYVASDVGSLFGGWLSGFVIGREWSINDARKAVIRFAACLMPAGILAAFTSDAMVALGLIGVVSFGFQVWINNVQTLPSDFFHNSGFGSVAGYNLAARYKNGEAQGVAESTKSKG